MIDTHLKNAVLAHAEAEYPRECCGLLVQIAGGAVRYERCRNLADKTDHFIMDPEDYAAAEDLGEIVGVVHSHPDVSCRPSQADKVACEASGLPWFIVSFPQKEWAQIAPEGYEAPLLGRSWAHGVLDCYTLIQDWYKRETGWILPSFERKDEWWKHGENLYVENFEKAGFVRVHDAPRHGDVLLMQIGSNVPNHGAIYLEGDNILHHLHNRLSCREVYGGYYRKHTTHILRFNVSDSHTIG